MQHREEKLKKLLKIMSISLITCCCILLLPPVRNFIVEYGEKVVERSANQFYIDVNYYLIIYLLFVILCFTAILVSLIKNVQAFSEKYREKIFTIASIVIVAMSIIVIIIMYIKCRSLWSDEAFFAKSFVTKNWLELLTPPLDHEQSAPVLYVIAVKAISSMFAYSESSLRIVSLFSFIGLLICVPIFLKKALNLDKFKIAFVVAMTALLPTYIWYSNEFKPYMGDALFAVLTILLYYFYTREKIKLPALIIFYILLVGFSSPAIFFIAGVLFFEFLSAIANKNKKQIFSVFMAGTVFLLVFFLYYYWWMLPVSSGMVKYWVAAKPFNPVKILTIFNTKGNSNSWFVWFFVPLALLGFFSLCKSKNKIACSVALSLFFAFLASAIGYWPMTGRLWLFLPAIVLFFAPVGIDLVHDKIKCKRITGTIEFSVFSVILIFLSVNCLGYTGDKMYYPTQEINPLIHYVRENIKEGEKLYICNNNSWYVFNYKNDYNATKIGNVTEDNVIYGINRREWNEAVLGNELQTILKNQKTYLIFTHYKTAGGKIDGGLAVLRNYGTLTEVINFHETLLYYFERASQ